MVNEQLRIVSTIMFFSMIQTRAYHPFPSLTQCINFISFIKNHAKADLNTLNYGPYLSHVYRYNVCVWRKCRQIWEPKLNFKHTQKKSGERKKITESFERNKKITESVKRRCFRYIQAFQSVSRNINKKVQKFQPWKCIHSIW